MFVAHASRVRRELPPYATRTPRCAPTQDTRALGGSIAVDTFLAFKRYLPRSNETGRSSAWLERTVRDREVAGSNPVAPTPLDGKPFDEIAVTQRELLRFTATPKNKTLEIFGEKQPEIAPGVHARAIREMGRVTLRRSSLESRLNRSITAECRGNCAAGSSR